MKVPKRPGREYVVAMDKKPKPLIPALAIAILVGCLLMAKPWLVQHLGINLLSVQNRLVMAVAAAIVCAICVVIVKVLNRPKPHI